MGSRITRTSTALIKAREIITQGWCRGELRKVAGKTERHCAIGAVYDAVGAQWGRNPTYREMDPIGGTYDGSVVLSCEDALSDAVADITSGKHWDIVGYNDYEATSRKAVLKVYDVAISAAKRAERRAKYVKHEAPTAPRTGV